MSRETFQSVGSASSKECPAGKRPGVRPKRIRPIWFVNLAETALDNPRLEGLTQGMPVY